MAKSIVMNLHVYDGKHSEDSRSFFSNVKSFRVYKPSLTNKNMTVL